MMPQPGMHQPQQPGMVGPMGLRGQQQQSGGPLMGHQQPGRVMNSYDLREDYNKKVGEPFKSELWDVVLF